MSTGNRTQTDKGISQEDHDTAVNAAAEAGKAEGLASGLADGLAEGHKAGMVVERQRIAGILNSDEAKGREAAAASLALSSDITAEAAIATLATLPKSSSIQARASGEAEMGGGDGGLNQPAPDAEANIDRMWASAVSQYR